VTGMMTAAGKGRMKVVARMMAAATVMMMAAATVTEMTTAEATRKGRMTVKDGGYNGDNDDDGESDDVGDHEEGFSAGERDLDGCMYR
jgi:hypothetical protein